MPKYNLSPAAQASLKTIRQYTVKEFGQKQAKVFLSSLRERMKLLAEQPSQCKERNDIKIGYYSYFVGSHTIYYRISDTHIDIIDVLHQSMEPVLHI